MTISKGKVIESQNESNRSSLKQSTLLFTQNKSSTQISNNSNKSNAEISKLSNDVESDKMKKFDITLEKVVKPNKETFLEPAKPVNVNSPRSQSCRPKGSKMQKSKNISTSNHNLFEFYPTFRRSGRCTEQMIKDKKEKSVIENIIHRKEEGMRIINTVDKGRGVESTIPFKKDSFVVEYAGDLISEKEAINREIEYQKDSSKGSYMFHFKHNNQKYCVDATAESGRLGRLLNHSKIHPNCYVKIISINNVPRLTIFAKTDIEIGEELIYDYGDRDRATIEANPWLKY